MHKPPSATRTAQREERVLGKIIDVSTSARFWKNGEVLAGSKELRYFRISIIKIAKYTCTSWATFNTRWDAAFFYAEVAQVALLNRISSMHWSIWVTNREFNVVFWLTINKGTNTFVWTRNNAALATNALFFVLHNNAGLFIFVRSTGWAHFSTSRLVAMIALY